MAVLKCKMMSPCHSLLVFTLAVLCTSYVAQGLLVFTLAVLCTSYVAQGKRDQ